MHKPKIVVIDEKVVIKIGEQEFIIAPDGNDIRVSTLYGGKESKIFIMPVNENAVLIGVA